MYIFKVMWATLVESFKRPFTTSEIRNNRGDLQVFSEKGPLKEKARAANKIIGDYNLKLMDALLLLKTNSDWEVDVHEDGSPYMNVWLYKEPALAYSFPCKIIENAPELPLSEEIREKLEISLELRRKRHGLQSSV